MAEILCGYTADRDEILIAYLYGDIDNAARLTFEAHLATCDRCRHELADLQSIRTELQTWSAVGDPPDSRVSAFVQPAPRSRMAWLREIPVWAQAAAALLFLGVSARVANLDVRYDQSGLTVRTGWSEAAGQPRAVDSQAMPAWRADLEALEQRVRAETAAARVPQPADSTDEQVLKRVRALIQESERKQQNEIALRIAEVTRDFDARRGSDLANIDRSLRTLQSNTGIEVARYGQLMNYLANRVSLQK
jgi:anti-sigma factor RsiW